MPWLRQKSRMDSARGPSGVRRASNGNAVSPLLMDSITFKGTHDCGNEGAPPNALGLADCDHQHRHVSSFHPKLDTMRALTGSPEDNARQSELDGYRPPDKQLD